jgi:pimeloyl-ACP methyl ester carboxylesterase
MGSLAAAGPDASVALVEGPWEHRMVAANGARFHVAELGDGPLVLLLHGFPEFWWAWRHQLVSLAEAGYRAAAMDLRGYGASDKPPRGYDPGTLADDITGVIRSLGAPDAVVVGHDWGGYLAWATAVLHPKVVRRLCAVSMPHPRRMRAALLSTPAQVRRSGHVVAFQTPIAPERRLVRDDGLAVEALLRRWAAPGWPDEETAATYRLAARIPGVAHSSLEYFRWVVRSVPRPDGLRFNHRMKQPVQVPTLHLHGAADRCLLPRSAQGSGLYVQAPYRWRLLDGVGHFPHEEAPDAFNEELMHWLGDPEPDW